MSNDKTPTSASTSTSVQISEIQQNNVTNQSCIQSSTTHTLVNETHQKLEMRFVERGICPIATSIMNELFQ